MRPFQVYQHPWNKREDRKRGEVRYYFLILIFYFSTFFQTKKWKRGEGEKAHGEERERVSATESEHGVG
jgi:hypothetical protein